MNNPWVLGILAVAALVLGVVTLTLLPVLVRLLAALVSRAAKWPGPRIEIYPTGRRSGRQHLALRPKHLFSEFLINSLGAAGAAAFFLLTSLSGTPWLAGAIRVRWSWVVPVSMLVALAGGAYAIRRAVHHRAQVRILLSDLAGGVEPRQVDGRSAEARYAVEHPLLGRGVPRSNPEKALVAFYASVRCQQEGAEAKALTWYQHALRLDPSLHERAREALAKRLPRSSPQQAGPIYYWMGSHSEWLSEWKRAAFCYQKAADAFHEIGYRHRESRARCNLGNVKMHTLDESAMDEFERAVALDPANGSAHLNIAKTYYGLGEPGDDRHERALDAYADAIIADPVTYGPKVIASLREIGYTWEKDLEEITQRVERKRRAAAAEPADATAGAQDEA